MAVKYDNPNIHSYLKYFPLFYFLDWPESDSSICKLHV